MMMGKRTVFERENYGFVVMSCKNFFGEPYCTVNQFRFSRFWLENSKLVLFSEFVGVLTSVVICRTDSSFVGLFRTCKLLFW